MNGGKELISNLELISTIGFKGKIKNGLLFHPDKQHIIFALGTVVIIRDIATGKDYRLEGHESSISCITVSKDGSLIASGQENYMGYKAEVIIWDFFSKKKYGSYRIHRVKVEALAFTHRTKYLVSLGGQDCGSVVIWDAKNKVLLCGSNQAAPIAGGYANLLCCANQTSDIFATAGENSLRIWKIDDKKRKIFPVNTMLGHIRREIKCIEIDWNDTHLYCGTASGDILKVSLNLKVINGETIQYDSKLLFCLTREKKKEVRDFTPLYSLGVTSLAILKTDDLIVGTGDGIICRVSQVPVLTKISLNKIVENKMRFTKPPKEKTEIRLRELMKTTICGHVTSIALRGEGHQFLVGTASSEIYQISLTDFLCELIYTCHSDVVNDVIFPYACSDTFATCSKETIRLWNLHTSQELLRITIPNMICSTIFFTFDGRLIISGWNDGIIRAHAPESGKPIYSIYDAHQRGVTALACTSDNKHIVSGGGEGDLRIWSVTISTQILQATMKEHKGAITCIRIKKNDLECVTSGSDGSCIIWDLVNYRRIQVIFANNLFQCACFGPEECHIIASGTNNTITYYETLEGNPVRALEGSEMGPINALDITQDCSAFVSGGKDKMIKVWKYNEGITSHIGYGHSDEITALRISPDQKYIISVSKDGCIIRWKYPISK